MRHAGANYTEAQRHNIVREVVDSRADIRGQSLGKRATGLMVVHLPTNRPCSPSRKAMRRPGGT